jgi:hypothetical protein
MSTLVEIEQAIDRLPDWDVDQLVGWLETRRAKKSTRPETPSDPDFLERARPVKSLFWVCINGKEGCF